LLRLKPAAKLLRPRNGKTRRIPLCSEVLKPLESADDSGFEPMEVMAVIGVPLTKFGDGWDLPPGLAKEALAMGDCDADSGADAEWNG
jgi:hypothetical protein